MTPVESATAAPPSYRWASVSLLLIAEIELLDALSSVQGIFTAIDPATLTTSWLGRCRADVRFCLPENT